jgi:hypothetical protein
VTVVARFKEYEDWLVESSHKLHGKGKNEALKEEKLAQVSFRVCLLFSSGPVTDLAASQNPTVRYSLCLANPIVRYITVHTVSGHCYLCIFFLSCHQVSHHFEKLDIGSASQDDAILVFV